MLRPAFGAAKMEGRRVLWLQVLIASAMVAAMSLNTAAAMADGSGQQPAGYGSGAPNTNMLCASKCGTCPTVCYSSPPPPSSSSNGGSSSPPAAPGAGGSSSPSPPSSPSHSTSPPGQGQNKGGGHPSSYYYFFTAGSGRLAGPSGYALVLVMVFVTLAAGFQ